jgi:type VII secretion integral membrane protein EccD
VLQRLGEAPLDPDATPETADLHDGDVLHLRPAIDPIPELHYDDLSEGVAKAIAARTDRWQPESTHRLVLGLAVLAEFALALVLVFGAGTGALAASSALVIALVLGSGSVAIDRQLEDRALALVAGLGACGFALLIGLLGWQDVVDVTKPKPWGVAVAGISVAVVAGALVAAGRTAAAVYCTIAATAGAAMVAGLLVTTTSLDGPGALGVVEVVLVMAGTFGPRISARFARLRLPDLPRTAAELQKDIDPVPGSVVTARTATADAYLTALIASGSVVAAVDALLVVPTTGWINWVLPLVFGLALLLRGRSLRSVWQRGATVWAGAVALAAVVVSYGLSLTPGGRTGVVVLLLGTVVLLVIGAWRLPTVRLLPAWGRLGDIAELWSALALVPLLLQLVHTYAFFRALAG